MHYDSLALHNMTLLIITAREGEEALHVVFLNFERGLSFRGLSFRGLSFRDTLSNYNCQGR